MPATDKINILVVDDLAEKVLVLESILAELDENVISARSGAEALQHVLQKDFAVILLDISMPGMDGFETAALIRKRKKSAHIPIIFITAYADEMHAAQGYSLGAVDYILAPVVPDVLRSKVRVFVDLFRMNQQVKKQAEERIALMQEQAARAAAEEANRRLAFLARAGNTLGRSLDFQATARDVAQLDIPALADLSAVSLVQPGDGTWTTIVARQENGGVSLAEHGGLDSLPPMFVEPVERVLASGNEELLRDVGCPEDEPAFVGVVLPLQARGRLIGALALQACERRFSGAEISIAEALASRAASALDNALLYSEVQGADRQKNEFLSMLAHELRNPLAPIHNAVKLLRAKAPAEADLQWAQEVIDRQVTQLVRLVDDLLDVSRITRGKIRLQMEPVSVQASVSQAVETSRPLIDARRHQFSLSMPAQTIWVRGDAVRLAQVLTNLLNNAAKYTDEGGHITLSVVRDHGEVVLRVRDTGIGIPTSMMNSIFELFTQVDRSLDRSQGGLGIGLTLVKRLVEMHDGQVSVYSAGPEQGSEFSVRLPVLTVDPEVPPAESPPAFEHSPVKLRVLVADDNHDAAESLAMLLRLSGHTTHTAYDGQAALQAAATHRPEVIFLDIGMPKLNGYEVAQRIRQQPWGRDIVLVAVTGWGQEEDRRRTEEAGFNHHLVKPVEHHAVLRLLAALEPVTP
jgi:signal transduction histidine kinase